MKKINNVTLWVIAIGIAAGIGACIDPEGDLANPVFSITIEEQHEHMWGEWEQTKAATCTEKGEAMRVCLEDPSHIDIIAVPTDPNAHNWESADDADFIPPNCTETGFGFQVCTRCAAEINGEIEPLGHTFEIHEITSLPNCTEPGVGFQLCTRCNRNEPSVTSALGHVFETYALTTTADCVTHAVETARCARIGCAGTDAHTLDLDPDAHNWGPQEYLAPNCVDEGATWHICTRCDTRGEEAIIDIDPDAHDWEGVDLAPTCLDPGYRWQTCTRCSKPEQTGAIAALGHEFESEYRITAAATCTVTGVKSAYCIRRSSGGCEVTDEQSIAIDPAAHEWNDLHVVLTAATCTAGGRIRVTCVFNEAHGAEQNVAALGHDWGSYVPISSPSCTTTGSRAATCSRNSAHQETQTIAALGHDFAVYTVTSAPTCTADGSRRSYCTRNSAHLDTQIVEALGHDYGAYIQTTAPTCTATGVDTRTCARVNTHRDTRTVDALGHNWSAFAQTTAPTCTVAGVNTRTCYRDNSHRETQTGASALGHNYGNWATTAAATCTATGTDTRICTRDSAHRETRTIAINASAHGYNNYRVAITPTCTSTGLEASLCSYNNAHPTSTRSIPIDPNAHNYVSYTVTTAPTCVATGIETAPCSRSASHARGARTIAINPNAHSWEAGDRSGNIFGNPDPNANNLIFTTTLDATCTTNGEMTNYCLLCTRGENKRTIDAFGHSVPSYTVTTAATCIATGEERGTCNRLITVAGVNRTCGETTTRVVPIDPNAHQWDAWGVNRTAATCSATGSEQRLCLRRNSHFETRTIPIDSNAHDYNSAWTYSGVTATANGTRYHVCSRNSSHRSPSETAYATGTAGLSYLWYSWRGGYAVSKGTVTSGAVFIPAYRLDSDTYLPVVGIGDEAFQNCTGITSVTIPATVTFINYAAFDGCTGITGSITIPAGVTEISSDRVFNCSASSIVVDASNPNYTSDSGILYNKAKTEIIAVPKGITGSVTIPTGVTNIPGGAFRDCTKLTGVTIPTTVTKINVRAFSGCTSLTSVNIPTSVTDIEPLAFENCTKIANITINANYTTVAAEVFTGWTSSQRVTVNNAYPNYYQKWSSACWLNCNAQRTINA